ncbi:ExbD/TolR family protein [Nisaea sediminum]|uniref:ExbD/TolR family protein n=1 Tax=Nisaea sediminum TaxID=2775867 RepID=UPI0018681274|nr:biopolymer transporter ExbD [Nisaea sediminum]
MRLAARRRRPSAEISLTPLIDVVFILLVFFMLASSFLDWRAIGLQTATLGGAGAVSEGSVLVKLRSDGGFLVSGESMDHAAFSERLASLAGRGKKPKIVLEAERGVPLQALVDTVDLAAAQGLTDVTLAGRRER